MEEVAQYEEHHRTRLAIKPGITGIVLIGLTAVTAPTVQEATAATAPTHQAVIAPILLEAIHPAAVN